MVGCHNHTPHPLAHQKIPPIIKEVTPINAKGLIKKDLGEKRGNPNKRKRARQKGSLMKKEATQ
jgi:hypothetical protein